MSFFRSFPKKSLYEVSQILVSSKHESILNFIEESEGGYYLNNSVENISPLKTYQFAVACSLASLGSVDEAEMIFQDPEAFIALNSENAVSRDLYNSFVS